MNQKKLRKRSLSWLLVLSMVLSLFGGEFTVPQKAKAAEGDATITFGESKINASGYYTYPDVTVTIPDSTKRIHNLTVTVNSGYIKVTSTKIEDVRGNYTTGKGILTTESIQEKNEGETGESAGLNAGSSTEDLSTDSTSRYESISFDFDARYASNEAKPGATADAIQSFLRTLRFTTSETEGQEVTISATTLGDADLKTTIDGQEITLHYFNGHFYGYVSKWCTWRQAYDTTQTAEFKGVQGYLATLTTRAEDRFLLSTFPLNDSASTNKAKEGWIGCTRATLESVLNGTEAKDLPKMTSAKDDNFIWRWVTGPEAGEGFGYQTNAYGQSGTWGNSYGDGGFDTAEGSFSNWGNRENGEWNIEPNGGGQTDEAFGYYGRYLYGRWNDYSADAGVTGFYIEFGGMPGDDETFQENLADQIIITSSETEPEIVNPNVDPTETSATPSRKLTGTPVVENRNEDKENKAGVRLYANTNDVGPEDATYTYKWYVQNEDTGVWEELTSTNDYITLTEDLLNHQIKVELVGTYDFADSVLSSVPYDAAITKDEITGEPVIEKKDKNDPLEAGTVLVANVDDIGPEVDTKDNLHYQWYVVEEDGTKTEVGKDEPTYVLKESDLGKDVVVEVTADADSLYTGSAESEPLAIPAPVVTASPSADPSASPELQMITGRPSIVNENTDEDGSPVNEVGTVLKAAIDEVKPDGAKESLIYQWYIRESNGLLTPIDGATEPTYTLTEEDLDKNLVVSVTGNEEEGYYGTRNSLPYSATQEQTPITGKPVIENETKNDEGEDVKREGTILTANIAGIDPDDSHSTLSYQWYVKDGDDLIPIEGATEKSYILTTDEVDKELVVTATGNGKYKGTVNSDPYDTTRTDSGVSVEEPDENGFRKIVVSPTMENTIYAIVDASGDGTPLIDIPTVDENGFDLSPNVFTEEYQGYYRPSIAGGKLIFTVEADKEYIIYAVRDKSKDVIIVGPDIDDVELKDYDDKGTPENNEDDTVSVEVNPADVNYRYAILEKVDGKYVDITVTYDPETKEWVYDPDSETKFTLGGEGKVVFSELPAEGTYKVVAIPIDSDVPDFEEVTPSQIEGGSEDIESHAKANIKNPSTSPEASNPPSSAEPSGEPSGAPSASAAPSASDTPSVSGAPSASGTPSASGAPTASGTPSASAAPGASGVPSQTGTTLTPEEEDAVTKFITNYVTDPNGNLITSITDLTKDIILSGETEWNKLTATEQNAVNERIKAAGSPYTYEELLAMANAYKIPGFKLHKVMKKKSKAKLKLMKCSGATVIVTSTNKKVATINKKGVIKAKKVGKATLTITAVKGNYSNRLVVNLEVRKKFKNATELKKFKSKVIKTPTILIAKKRKLKKSTKIKIYGLEKNAKVTYKSYNKKALPINKKGRYTAKKKGKSLMRVTVKQNDKVYYLYLYVTAFKKGGKKK